MAYYAKVNNNIVEQVIVADEAYFETFIDSSPGVWIETSMDGSIRKNYASVGYSYDDIRDAFIAEKDHASWLLDEDTCTWRPPVAYPDDNKAYTWNEETTSWVEVQETDNG
jgi:hypothetical protein